MKCRNFIILFLCFCLLLGTASKYRFQKDLKEMIEEGKPIEVNCHFCNTSYTFSIEELKEIFSVKEDVKEVQKNLPKKTKKEINKQKPFGDKLKIFFQECKRTASVIVSKIDTFVQKIKDKRSQRKQKDKVADTAALVQQNQKKMAKQIIALRNGNNISQTQLQPQELYATMKSQHNQITIHQSGRSAVGILALSRGMKADTRDPLTPMAGRTVSNNQMLRAMQQNQDRA